jgi:hypothetical protein
VVSIHAKGVTGNVFPKARDLPRLLGPVKMARYRQYNSSEVFRRSAMPLRVISATANAIGGEGSAESIRLRRATG